MRELAVTQTRVQAWSLSLNKCWFQGVEKKLHLNNDA